MQYIKMKNGLFLGCIVLRIEAIPHYSLLSLQIDLANQKVVCAFKDLLQEIYHYSLPGRMAIEILWVNKPVENQTYTSKIQMYLVIRVADETEQLTAQRENTILQNIANHLQNINFRFSQIEIANEELNEGIDRNTHPFMSAIVKAEQFPISTRAILPYYYISPFENEISKSLGMLLQTLTSMRYGTVSFQLITSAFTDKEKLLISEYCTELCQAYKGGIVRGMPGDAMAAIPFQKLSYYRDAGSQPIYQYNIVTMGMPETCVALNAQICSLLREKEDTKFITINLKNSAINLREEFAYYPWRLNQLLMQQERNIKFFQNFPNFKGLMRLPYMVTVAEAMSFFKLPVDEGNMKGIESTKLVRSTERFSEKVVSKENIQFGKLITENDNAPNIGCNPKAFTKHALIVGMPGSGKTTFSVNMLLQFYRKKIPFLAIEPTKTEYRAMIDAIPDLQIFTPGNTDVSPFIINPFIPPKGIRIEQYIPSLASAFKAAFSMPSPLDMFFLKAIRESYSIYGWKDYSTAEDEEVQFFGLYEFILIFKRLVNSSEYSKEVKGNMQSGGVLRLQNLIEQNSNIYDVIHTVPIEDLLSKPTILELNAIDNAEQKSLLMALLLINICVFTKHNNVGDGEIKNAILIDEAHVLLNPHSSEGNVASDTTIKTLQDMIAEIRSYGTSIIIADQSPTAVSRAVVANTDIKVAFRLVQSEEKSIIADSTNMSEQAEKKLGRLGVGEAYIYFSQLEEPQLIQTPDIRGEENIRLSVKDAEVAERSTYWNTRKELLIPFTQCSYSEICKKCNFRLRSNADYFANKYYFEYEDKISDLIQVDIYMRGISKWINKQLYGKETIGERVQLCNCIKIRFLRKILLDKNIKITDEQQQKILQRSMNDRCIE